MHHTRQASHHHAQRYSINCKSGGVVLLEIALSAISQNGGIPLPV